MRRLQEKVGRAAKRKVVWSGKIMSAFVPEAYFALGQRLRPLPQTTYVDEYRQQKIIR